MRRHALLFLLPLLAVPLAAGDWGIGAGSGAFLFGDFARFRSTVGTELSTVETEEVLAASTRPGLQIHLERFAGARWSIRSDATIVRAPLSVGASGDEDGVSLDIGDLDVLTVSLAAAFRFNRDGRLRPFLYAGPVWAQFAIREDEETGVRPIFDDSRDELGAVAGAGLEWWVSERFAIRGEISDIVTPSPFEESDFEGIEGQHVEIPDAHNIHTVVGVTWRF
ncbi:MAG TPA: outer membrane beta-barrel protein [Thermoanaerobaculia bacterium]|nr:outer membrane beta-barrel protein [Thermoanaerobaculia bacterium]